MEGTGPSEWRAPPRPAHHLAEHVVPHLAAHFPNAGVGTLPVLADPVHESPEHAPRPLGHLVIAPPDVRGLQHFPVDVELQLARGAVPHPDGTGSLVSREMVELTLDEISAAVDAVHDLEVPAAFVAADLL